MLLVKLNYDDYQNNDLHEEVLVSIFLAITNFQQSLSTRCHRGYEDTIARIIREQLEIIFYKMLLKPHPFKEKQGLKTAAVMLSWGFYGASVDWKRNNPEVLPERFITSVIPYILSGINLDATANKSK